MWEVDMVNFQWGVGPPHSARVTALWFGSDDEKPLELYGMHGSLFFITSFGDSMRIMAELSHVEWCWSKSSQTFFFFYQLSWLSGSFVHMDGGCFPYLINKVTHKWEKKTKKHQLYIFIYMTLTGFVRLWHYPLMYIQTKKYCIYLNYPFTQFSSLSTTVLCCKCAIHVLCSATKYLQWSLNGIMCLGGWGLWK